MNKIELRETLKREGIPSHYYSLESGLPYDVWCIVKTYNGWETYYAEKGQKYQAEVFQTEEEACERIYRLLIEIKKWL